LIISISLKTVDQFKICRSVLRISISLKTVDQFWEFRTVLKLSISLENLDQFKDRRSVWLCRQILYFGSILNCFEFLLQVSLFNADQFFYVHTNRSLKILSVKALILSVIFLQHMFLF
jgi:hypothetical protein